MRDINTVLLLVELYKNKKGNHLLLLKVGLMIALGLTCSSAMAKWTKVTANDEATTYADVSTLNRVGDIAKMSDVMDMKNPRAGVKYSSIKSLHEYDCKLNKSRVVAYSMYSGNMAGGKIVDFSSRIHDWLPAKFGGATAALWKIACDKH